MSIGKMIKFYRKENGLTQGELAEMIGVSTQAISKWETEAGMPDISQLVPLATILNVSTDKLLGLDHDRSDEEIISLREAIGHHPVYFSADEAKRIYDLARPFFEKHPTNAEAAFLCLESLATLIAKDEAMDDRQSLLKECERYERCILRYEIDPDVTFKSYYVISRCYSLLGEREKSEKVTEKIPYTFGDRTYWEAEFAFADGDMETALKKCKTSFHDKARYISRCIRLARMINQSIKGNEGLKEQLDLNEYMLNIINAFLTGGDYLPYRMIYQKLSLLSGLVTQYSRAGIVDRAIEHMNELIETRRAFLEFLKHPEDSHCLMFPEGDNDGIWHVTLEKVDGYVSKAYDALYKLPQLKESPILNDLSEKINN